MKFERINGKHGYGVKVILDSSEQIGKAQTHTDLTRNNPAVVNLDLDRIESDLAQQLSDWLLTKEIK